MHEQASGATFGVAMGVVPHVTHTTDVDKNRRLWRRWVVAVTLGELVGFSVPSIAGGIAWALRAAPGVLYATLVCAGAGEGAVLATAQWIVLRDELPRLPARSWIGVTAAAAAFAWGLGMLPSTLGDRLGAVPFVLLAPALGAGGIALLLSIGTVQSLVLRSHVRRAWQWIPANALAWCAGLVVAVSFMSVLLTEDTTLAQGIAVGAAAGVLMGAAVAAVTGWFLVRILESR